MLKTGEMKKLYSNSANDRHKQYRLMHVDEYDIILCTCLQNYMTI